MSVFIKGMDMPFDCSNCDFCRIVDGHYYCNRTKHKISVYYGSRQGDCPIINILTPHGDLIDRNEILDEINLAYPFNSPDYSAMFDMVSEIDEVIESENI